MIPHIIARKHIWTILLFCIASPIFTQIISQELFDELDGSTSGVMSDGSTWAAGIAGQCDGNGGIWGVQAGSFTINDIEGFNCCNCGSGNNIPPLNCGNNQSEILFNDIDIAGVCGNVSIEILWQGSSGMECDFPGAPEASCTGGHDQLVAEYSIDNGPFIVFGYLCGNTVIMPANTGFVLSGTELDIRISGGNQAAAETYTVQSVTVSTDGAAALQGSLSGGGSICGSGCTTVNWTITGGTPLYDLGFTATYGGIPISFNLPGSQATGSMNVCLDSGTPIASYDPVSNTIFANPSFANLLTIDFDDVSDSNGCNTTVLQSVSINVVNPPPITDIPDIQVCTDAMGIAVIDLTQYESAIGNGNPVNWYSNAGLTVSIGPSFSTGVNTTIYATVDDGMGCESTEIEIDITLFLPPLLDQVQDVFACDMYVLPTIAGQNLINPAYYTGPNQTGDLYFVNQVIDFNTTIYIYDDNSVCNDEVFFTITILPSPEIDPLTSVTECGYYILPPITGTNVNVFAQYWTLPGGMGLAFNAGDTIDFSTVLYAYDEFGNCPAEEIVTILISQSPSLDSPAAIDGCGQVVLPPIEGENLSGSEAYFTGPNGSGNSFQPGDIIMMSQLLFIYDEIGNCFSQVTINVNISQGPVLEPIADITVCEFYVLPAIISNSGGQMVDCYYTIQGTQMIEGDTVFNSTSVDYICEVVNNLLCFAQLDFSVEVEQNLSAGQDDTITSCIGSIVDLLSILSADAESGGTFIDISGTGAIANNNLDLNLIGALTEVDLAYAVGNSCGEDTAFFRIEVQNFVDAGTDISNVVCEGASINLNDLVDGTPGGNFYEAATGTSIPSNINTNGEAGNTLEFLYIVGDGVTCDPDSATVNVEVTESPSFANQPIVTSCGPFSLTTITGTGIDPSASYYTEPEGQGVNLPAGTSITESSVVYLYYNNGLCSASDSLVINVGSITNTFITETVCSDGFIEVNGTIYDIDLQAGTEQLAGMFGCDSFLIINLDFIEADTANINTELCFGQSIMVNGMVYDEINPTGIEILDNMAASGCDSIIEVDLQFSSASITPITEMICSNDSLLINGKYYSLDNPNGMDTIQGNSGCDSILDIQLSFLFASNGVLDATICSEASIVVNGTIYNASNPTGSESIPGANQFGCDSIINIDLTFYDVEQGLYSETVCPGDTLVIMGVEFYEDNPEQLIILEGASAQNCDSSVLVSLDFYEIDEGIRFEILCSGGSITIEGTEYNEDNPTGQYTLQNSNGCDSIINVSMSFESVVSDLEIVNPVCDGDENGYVVFNGLSVDGLFYAAILDGVPFLLIEPGDTFFNLVPGEHFLEIFTEVGCTSNNTFTIADPASVSVQIPDIVVIQEGDTYQVNLDPPSDAEILWTPDIDISCTDCANPVFSPGSDMTYYLTVTTEAGCMDMDTITIRVEEQIDIYIPNVFSPNDDGINDVFGVFAEDDLDYELYIYDRAGNFMYTNVGLKTNNPSIGWDGTFNGQLCNPGVFAYYAIVYIPADNQDDEPQSKLINGTITLIL